LGAAPAALVRRESRSSRTADALTLARRPM